METTYRHIEVENVGNVYCVHLKKPRLDEPEIQELGRELLDLIDERGCRKLAFSLGPESVKLLFSIFLAKLVMVRRRILEKGGHIRLYDVSADVMGVFAACQLDSFFEFATDRAAAVADLAARQ
jgi:anti-anti-sigma factor